VNYLTGSKEKTQDDGEKTKRGRDILQGFTPPSSSSECDQTPVHITH